MSRNLLWEVLEFAERLEAFSEIIELTAELDAIGVEQERKARLARKRKGSAQRRREKVPIHISNVLEG